MTETREIADLRSVGPGTVEALQSLGIHDLDQLAQSDAEDLYVRLCELQGSELDPCAQDVLRAAIAQAQDPDLPDEMRDWWYWSQIRTGKRRRG